MVWPLENTTPSASNMVVPPAVQATLEVRPSMRFGLSPTLATSTPAVPNVFFAAPSPKHACPNRPACWSARMPVTGMPGPGSPPKRRGSTSPKWASDATAGGRISAGMSHAASSAASQPSSARLSNAVREACVWSVRWERPSVRFHRIHVSTVPTAISPRRARAANPSTFSMYQASFGAVKYESLLSPVRAGPRGRGLRPATAARCRRSGATST
jgi:hypothetical protein